MHKLNKKRGGKLIAKGNTRNMITHSMPHLISSNTVFVVKLRHSVAGCPCSEYSGWGPHVSLITSAKPSDAIRWRQALLFHSLMDANESAVARARWRYAIRKRKARHVILNAPRHVTVVGLQVASPLPHITVQ